jgi:hypothetical protein
MRKRGWSRQGTMSLNSTKEDMSREPQVDKTCLGETCQSAVIQALTTQIVAQMMMWRMTPICHHLGLVLMEKVWQVQVAVRKHEREIVEEEEGNDGPVGDEEEEEETVFVDEINPSSYVHMGTPTFLLPLNLDWREKISYKGKTDMREKRKENLRLVKKEPGIDYKFHMTFQQYFYESVIIPKNKLVAISQ